MINEFLENLKIECYKELKKNKNKMTRQQFNSLKGQIKSQNYNSVLKGISNIRSLYYDKFNK